VYTFLNNRDHEFYQLHVQLPNRILRATFFFLRKLLGGGVF